MMSTIRHEVSINRLAPGGDGEGVLRDKRCFVPFTAPGDRITARITKENRKIVRAELEEMLSPSPVRREPPCPLFGACGGCAWQHLDAETQRESKEALLVAALKRPAAVVPSPRLLGYRVVARMHVGPGPSGRQLGFHHYRTRDIVPVVSCPVLAPALSSVIPHLQSGLLPHLPDRCTLRLAYGGNGSVALVSTDTPLSESFYQAATRLVPTPLAGVVLDVDGIVSTIAGTGDIRQTDPDGHPFITPAGSFGQANPDINRVITDTVLSWIEGREVASALELFAGAGNLSRRYARCIPEVTISELDAAACDAAVENLRIRGLDRVSVEQGDALEVYRRLGDRRELIVLDPPRDGHLALCQAIARGDHRAVIYISCNPATLARDLAPLEQVGYNCTAAMGFDMFPQTPHMEAAVKMER